MRVALALLLVATVATAAPAKHKPGALVLVLDRSGSMQGPKLEAAKAAANAAIDALQPDDQVEVVLFDSDFKIWIPLTTVSDRKFLKMQIDRIDSGGGTNILPALRAAHAALKPLKVAHRHVILMTDGEAPSDGLHELLQDMRDSRITVSTVGVEGADRNLLSMIADAGEGQLYMVDDLSKLPKLFAAEVDRAMR